MPLYVRAVRPGFYLGAEVAITHSLLVPILLFELLIGRLSDDLPNLGVGQLKPTALDLPAAFFSRALVHRAQAA
jgi:hypothetical protein